MLDFSEIPEDGNAFELLTRELLFRLGFHVQWSGKGPDGGKDLICIEKLPSIIHEAKRAWLVQCKHYAHSGKSVGRKDLDNIVDACAQHKADAFLLVCSTHPSSAAVSLLDGVATNEKYPLQATFWDAAQLERLLTTPETWGVAQTFMPKSAGAADWQVYATTQPNHWIAVHKDLYIHIHNRIGSHVYPQFPVVQERLNELKKFKLPKGHFFALRSIFYDDKNGCYTWYLDYMRPKDDKCATTESAVQKFMDEDTAYHDGQFYHFDVLSREYFPFSDHYDRNHYEYYFDYIGHYMTGIDRPKRYSF